jgi:glycosyltransferase involved in cell wall biosynthesis
VLEPTGMFHPKARSLRIKRVFDATLGTIFGTAQRVIATSELEARELREEGLPAERIRVRPNGVDSDQLGTLPPRGQLRERLGIPKTAPLVLFLGRIAAVKNLVSLVEAVSETDLWAVIAGPDSHDGTLDTLYYQLERTDAKARIRLVVPGLWGSDRLQAFADADCLCLPSWSENFGNVAAEAAAMGLPVVVSSRAGVAEWLPQSIATIVEPDDRASLMSAMVDATSDSRKVRASGVADAVRVRLSWESVVRTQEQIYSELI